MITKELIKTEIDRVEDKYLEALYKIIKALETSAEVEISGPDIDRLDWRDFVEETYGCLADAPIERGDQGEYEVRGVIE